MKRLIYLIAVSIGLLTSCTKEELVENTVYEKVAPGDPKYSYFKVLNVTAGSPVVNYYLDGTKSSALYSTTGVESGYAYNGIFPDLGYATATPGTRNLAARLTSAATPVADRGLEVFNAPFNFAAGKYYTVLLAGIYNTTSKKIESSLVLEDSRPALDTSKIYVRFANLYNGGPNLTISQAYKGVSQTLGTNVAFGKASDWVSINSPGQPNVYTITNSATGAVVFPGVAAGVTLTKGRAYTLYLRGVQGNTTYPATFTFYTTFY